nr:diguanylate cyclase [Methylomarinum sp. Ch1-1]MDP4522823.1 diguanylate cyclase [Methylomarinum sp. Ch1-1]
MGKKYFSLLDEHDALEKYYQDNEALLCKTIIRLSLATTGFSEELDPYLTRIRKQLKNGLKTEKLKQELDDFSNALMTFDESATRQPDDQPRLLIEFLGRHFPRRQDEFERIYRKFRNNSANSQELLLALHELVDEEQSVVSEIHQDGIDDEAIRTQLVALLDADAIPATLTEQAEQLQLRLQNETVPAPAMLSECLDLLTQMKDYFRSEQQNMAEFLCKLGAHLEELGQHSVGATTASQQTLQKRNVLDQSVSRQILELQQNSAQSTQLEVLKQLVDSKLSSIARQLQDHQRQEQREHEQHKQAMQQLTEKIKRLELKSNELNNKLNLAHNPTIRDPLTGLPNHQAYQQRLTLEMARLQQDHTPLSLIICDIDRFNNIIDSYGRKAGDKTLKIIARLLAANCRETDFIARYQDEKFLLLLTDTDAQTALAIAEKLRRLIAGAGFNSSGDKIAITLSCGVCQFTISDSGDTVFKRAAAALSKAKKDGRNRCVLAS